MNIHIQAIIGSKHFYLDVFLISSCLEPLHVSLLNLHKIHTVCCGLILLCWGKLELISSSWLCFSSHYLSSFSLSPSVCVSSFLESLLYFLLLPRSSFVVSTHCCEHAVFGLLHLKYCLLLPKSILWQLTGFHSFWGSNNIPLHIHSFIRQCIC